MASLALLGTIASIASAGLAAAGSIAAGKAQQEQAFAQAKMIQDQAAANRVAAEYSAQQHEIAANEERAQGQQEAAEAQRRKNQALSALQNRFAGSGWAGGGPDELTHAGDIAEYGSLQEQLANYGGASRQRGLRDTATAERYNADSAVYAASQEGAAMRSYGGAMRTASYLDAGSTLVGSFGNLAMKYGGGTSRAKKAYESIPSWNTTVRYG